MKPDRPSRILLHGCYANRNFGDLLMLDLLSLRIRERFGTTPICPWIHKDKKKSVLAKPGHGLFDFLFAQAAILGGGGYLYHTAGQSLKGLKRYSLPASIWQKRAIPYAIIGVGAGPAMSPEGREHVLRICDGARAITLRDQESHDLLVEAGVPKERIRATADLALDMVPGDIPDWAHAKAGQLLGVRTQDRIRLGLHFETYRKQPEKLAGLIGAIAGALARHDHVEPIWLFDHDMRSLPRIAELCEKHRLINPRFIPCQDHWTTAALIAQLDAVITSKLHVGIAAWTLGVPAAGYSVHPKTHRFFSQCGRSQFQCADTAPPDIVAHWIALVAEHALAFNTLDAGTRTRLANLAAINYAVLDDFLNSALG